MSFLPNESENKRKCYSIAFPLPGNNNPAPADKSWHILTDSLLPSERDGQRFVKSDESRDWTIYKQKEVGSICQSVCKSAIHKPNAQIVNGIQSMRVLLCDK